MKIFIIGATGFIGFTLARKLRDMGHAITGLARTAEKAALLRNNGITPQLGDLEDPSSFGAVIRTADVVIHAGFVFVPEKGLSHTADDERRAIQLIIDQLAEDRLFIYTSGSGVLGDTGPSPVNEIYTPRPIALNAWRPTIEQQVIRAPGTKGIVIRPGLVYDEEGGPVIQMLGQFGARQGHTFYIGDGLQKWSVIHLDDLCELFGKAIVYGAGENIYHGVSDEAISMKYLAQWAGKKVGITAEPLSVTLQEAETYLPIAELLAIDIVADNGKAKRALHWMPRHTF